MPRLLLRLALCLLLPTTVRAQATGFTTDDALRITTPAIADLSADGRWLAATFTVRSDQLGADYTRDSDPTYIRPIRSTLRVIDTQTGASQAVFADARILRGAVWSPDGASLALLVVGGSGRFDVTLWDRASGRSRVLSTPAGTYPAETGELSWSRDGRALHVPLRSVAWQQRATREFARLTRGPIIVQDGKDPFLAWDAMRRLGSVRSVVAIDVRTGAARTLIPEGPIQSWRQSDDSVLTWQQDITPRTDYDVIFGTEHRLLAKRPGSDSTLVLEPTLKGMTVAWSEDGRRYAWSKEGRVFIRGLDAGTARQIAGPDTGRVARDTADTTARAATRFAVVRWSPSGQRLLLSNSQGYWVADVATGHRELLLATDTLPSSPRHAPVGWSPDDASVYLSYASRIAWERGFTRVDVSSRTAQPLRRDARMYGSPSIARAAGTMVYTSNAGNRPADLYAADASASAERRLTTANPQLDRITMPTTRLISYRDVDGRTRHGVVWLPPDSSVVPRATLFNIYEDFFDDGFDATVNVLASQGYVVVKPSVAFETGFPGEAWLKGVTSAANALIDRGWADSARLGVFGTSYGGYATNLLITQTKRFKAAVNVSGKVDIISFYTDSPRLGVRNIHAAEKSQDRIGATLWQQPQKYVAHSAVMFADRITTPLLLMTGQQDFNVPADNTREMYYALRRLGKDVTWVNYFNSGHGTPGTSASEFVDFHDRLLGFFGKHLKGESGERVQEAIAATGEPLYRPSITGAARTRMETQLADARRAWEHAPADADSIIWYGRRIAYLGRYADAIALFSEGIERHPMDARMYRHRGHRYLTTRQVPLAIRDFERAAVLIRGTSDVIEPDGQPNARNTPTSSLHSNVWYHLALARYVSGDYGASRQAWEECLKTAKNPDMQVATRNWLYLTLRRMGRRAEAEQVLAPVTRDMDIIENGVYHKLLLLYKGELQESDVLGGGGALSDVSAAYGVSVWHHVNGRAAEAQAIRGRILAMRSQWAAFGYLAAEADAARD